MNNYPQFPLYIPTKGRYNYMITSKALTEMGVSHYLIVEAQEVQKYKTAISEMGLLTEVIELDHSFKLNYELCDNFGFSKSTGPGPARNCAWEHSISNGFDFHWVMDDNIKYFAMLNKNSKIKCVSPAFWKSQEDFVLRYDNVGMAGPNYTYFAKQKTKVPPFILNSRIYSCNLIRNDIKYRWRGRYNEDTILSIDMLKGGWCTIQFYAFLQHKMQTQSLKGGNTDEFYHTEGSVEKGKKYTDTGTICKSQMLVDVHPDVSKLTYKFGRIHHQVGYSKFKKNILKKKNIEVSKGIDNYGMELKKRGD